MEHNTDKQRFRPKEKRYVNSTQTDKNDIDMEYYNQLNILFYTYNIHLYSYDLDNFVNVCVFSSFKNDIKEVPPSQCSYETFQVK